MNFNSNSAIEGKHAFLSPSSYHWINYTDQKLEARWHTVNAARKGTELHELARMAIKLGIKLSKANPTLSQYVADAIKYKMSTEQPLYYSENCFGHADCISFRRNTLRIHDLKTGITPASVHQLEVYAAIFCLEYCVDPFSIEMEFRIYQDGEAKIWEGDPDTITTIMHRIVDFDKRIEQLKEDDL